MTAMRSGRVLIVVAAFGLLASAAVAVGVSVVSGYVFSPPRRELQAYHNDRLAHPAGHGLRIAPFECTQAKAPCLLVEPDAHSGPGARGSTLLAGGGHHNLLTTPAPLYAEMSDWLLRR